MPKKREGSIYGLPLLASRISVALIPSEVRQVRMRLELALEILVLPKIKTTKRQQGERGGGGEATFEG